MEITYCVTIVLIHNTIRDFLASVAIGEGHKAAPIKISKTKKDLPVNIPHRSMYPLPPLFACSLFLFLSHDVTMTSFL